MVTNMKRFILLSLLAFVSTLSFAQVTVKGVVYEPSGDTAIGASVIEKGKPENGTVTDIDGAFSLKVSSPNATIVVSYIGAKTQEIALQGKKEINVSLKNDDKLLDEVVVVGYGTQKKINATGSVKTIGNDVLQSRPIGNAVQGLQGAVAGLNITNDNGGGLGGEMSINIRGVGSIGDGSDSSPLILIDGIEGDLSTINPNDIENISVLKDAAAASIYGSRAPFGVILVTTKGGKKELQVNYTGNLRIAQPVKVPKMVDSYTYALMVNDSWVNSGGVAQFGKVQLDNILKYQQGLLTEATQATEDGSEWRKNQQCWGNTDWYDQYLKKATVSHEHNVSVTGGNKLVSFFASANYMGQTGLFNYANESYDRFTLNGKLNFTFNKYVKLLWNTRFINTKNDKPSALNDLFYHNLGRRSPLAPVTLPNGEYSAESLIPTLTNGGRQVNTKRQLYNQASLTVEPVKDWKIHVDLSHRYENNPYTRDFLPLYQTQPNGNLTFFSVLEGVSDKHSINVDNGNFNVQPSAGELYNEKASTHINFFTTNVYTDYVLNLGENHHFKFLLGEQSEFYRREINRDAVYWVLTEPNAKAEGDGTTLASWKCGEWSSLGFFSRINYNYADRYMVEVNVRADGASRFPSDQRWCTFPSASVGWNIMEEPFMAPVKNAGFEYLKFRASYGVLGNQNTTSFYPYFQKMETNNGNVVLGGLQAVVLPAYAAFSNSLTWEKIENYGVGVDWGWFDNRFTGSFDWYQRTTKDMVGPAQALSAIYGTAAPKTNNAELRTRGWEFEIGWRDRIGKDFSYGISGSISDYNTIITKYDSPDNAITGWYTGKKYGDIWGYQVEGIAKSDEEMFNHLAVADQAALGSNWGGGDIMYKDVDGNGTVDQGSGTLADHGDLTLIGNSTPKYAYSFTLEAKYKWLDTRIYFQGVAKRQVYFKDSATFFGVTKPWQRTIFTDHADYFRYADSPLGYNPDAYYARLRTDGNNIYVCDRFLQNAGYLRLKNVQIGVDLVSLCKIKKYIKKARLYVSGENLLTFTGLRIYDPEAVGSSDSEYGPGKTYPQYRTWSLGLDVTF